MADAKMLRVGLPLPFNAAAGLGTHTLNQANDALEWIFQALEAITITRLGVRQGAVTGTAPTYRLSLQGVDAATGIPDGTIKSSGNAKADFQPVNGDNGRFKWYNLDASYTCTRGEYLSVVLAYQSGTIDGSNNAIFIREFQSLVGYRFPYAAHLDNGARTKSLGPPVFGYGSSAKAYGYPVKTNVATSFNDASNPDEWGTVFTLPSGWGSTFQVLGVRFLGQMAAGSPIQIQLYDGTTVLQSVTHDSDIIATGGSTGSIEIYFADASLATLTYGNTYRIGFAPQNNVNLNLYFFDVDNEADRAAFPGGQDFGVTSRVNSGAWTDLLTRRQFLELIIADTTPGGGGGSSVPLIGQGLVY